MRIQTLILNRKDIESLVEMSMAIECIEGAFREMGLGRAQMPPKVYLDLKKYHGDFRAMPAYLAGSDSCGIKWVNAHPDNLRQGLPSVMALIILSDPKTGFPLCIMDGTYLTSIRTAAAGAVAAKYLARKDASIIGLVGCGVQARSQLTALREIFRIRRVKVWGQEKSLIDRFIKEMKGCAQELAGVGRIKDCVQEADIVVTTTPSRKPLVKLEWLKKGVHINAIGADAPGKQELDPAILKEAILVVDDWTQAAHGGEINVPFKKGWISQRDIHATLGEVVVGKNTARTNQEEITVFDSTGLAIQDVAIGQLIYKMALRKKIGISLGII